MSHHFDTPTAWRRLASTLRAIYLLFMYRLYTLQIMDCESERRRQRARHLPRRRSLRLSLRHESRSREDVASAIRSAHPVYAEVRVERLGQCS